MHGCRFEFEALIYVTPIQITRLLEQDGMPSSIYDLVTAISIILNLDLKFSLQNSI